MKKLEAQIHIDPQSDNLFTISYIGRSPRRAYRIVQTLVDIYVERASAHNQSDINNATAFLDTQIAYFKSQLKDVEQRRARFEAKYLEILPGANGVSQYEMEQSRVRSLEGDLQDTIAERNMMEKELAKTKPMLTASEAGGGGVDPALQSAEERLAQMELQYTPAYPGVIEQKRIVAMLKAQASGRPSGPGSVIARAVPNPIYEQLKVRLIQANTAIFSLKRKIKTGIAERDRLATLARSQPELEANFTNLDRNYGVLLNKYHDLLSRREAMRIGPRPISMRMKSSFRSSIRRKFPGCRSRPSGSCSLSLCWLLGLGAGAGCAMLFAEIEGCFYSIEDLRRIGLPVIGGITHCIRPAGALVRL